MKEFIEKIIDTYWENARMINACLIGFDVGLIIYGFIFFWMFL